MSNCNMRIGSRLLVLVLGSLMLPACATTNPLSNLATMPSQGALDYYPLRLGWGWAYEIERDDMKVLALYSVSERTQELAIVRNVDERIEYQVSPDGISRRSGGFSGDYLMKLPLVTGAEWLVADGTAKVVDSGRSITLPSGTYRDCVTIEEVRRDPNRVTRTTYCKNVGPVEIEMQVFNPMKKTYETNVRARLLSVTRPEKQGQAQ
jgi:hypothetical protein